MELLLYKKIRHIIEKIWTSDHRQFILGQDMLRTKAADIIIEFLTKKIDIEKAIRDFPKDTADESIECAYHALLHYDADEDYREQDSDYAEEQWDHLENIAILLKKGEPLPVNIIEEYRKYYESSPTMSKNTWREALKSLFRFTI